MDFLQYEQRFRELAVQSGYSEDNIQKCLNYAHPLIEKSLPVIYNTQNLSALVGYKKNFIKKAALYTSYFYRSFDVRKKNGGVRHLKEPLPSLKEIQCWILENILYEIPVSKFAKAYIRDRNLVQNVKYHKNKDFVLTIDIKDFFPSIKRVFIERILLNQGYSSNISNLLSKLCCCDDHLPQGAPTSPYLSNIYLTDFDAVVSSYCKIRDIRYTRYADDLTFSSNHDFLEIVDFVKGELQKLELSVNADKVRMMKKNSRQIVTGVIVNQKLQIPKTKRKVIRQEVYYIKKFGLESHLQKTQNLRKNYLYHLIGKINFALHINPHDKEMKDNLLFIRALLTDKDITNS